MKRRTTIKLLLFATLLFFVTGQLGGCLSCGPGTGSISGTVKDTAGNALSGATVKAGGVQATTGTNGTYKLENVPAGAQTVTASKTGYITKTQQVTVTAGQETTNVNFALVLSVVLIDDAHQNENDFDGYDVTDFYATLISTLQGMGYTVKLASTAGFSPSISTYGIVILPAPFQAYTNDETQALVNFVKNGGKLIMMGDWGGYAESANTNLNNLSSALGAGITFNMDTVYDDTNNYNGNSEWPVTSEFVSHATTNGLSSIAYILGCSLLVQNPATVIVYAEDTAYTYANLNISKGNSTGSGIKAPGTKTITEGSIILSAVVSIEKGKVIAIGDVNIFGDDVFLEETDFINILDNLKFFKNIINW